MKMAKQYQIVQSAVLVETPPQILSPGKPKPLALRANPSESEHGRAGKSDRRALQMANMLEVPIREACATMKIMKRTQMARWRRSAETPLQGMGTRRRDARATKITKRTQNQNREHIANQCDPNFGGDFIEKTNPNFGRRRHDLYYKNQPAAPGREAVAARTRRRLPPGGMGTMGIIGCMTRSREAKAGKWALFRGVRPESGPVNPGQPRSTRKFIFA